MREKEPQFTVTDRRKFTAEGELRDTFEPAAAAPAVATEEEAFPELNAVDFLQTTREYEAASLKLNEMLAKANPGQPLPPAMSFDLLVQSLFDEGAAQLGAGAAPGEQPRVNVIGARQSIDTLMVLYTKTQGSLNKQDKYLLQSALQELCGMFKEVTDMIFASAAQRAPKASKPY
jgi:hypothetical protein